MALRRKVVNILVITPEISKQISDLEIDERFALLMLVVERATDLDKCCVCHVKAVTDKSLPRCPDCKRHTLRDWAERRTHKRREPSRQRT